MLQLTATTATLSDWQQIRSDCAKLLLRSEAIEALRDALKAEEANFNGFNQVDLGRLRTLFEALRLDEGDPNFDILKQLRQDPVPFVICGLSLSTKRVKRMKNETLRAIIEEAKGASARLGKVIVSRQNVTATIRDCADEDFKRSYDALVEAYRTSDTQSSVFMWGEFPCYRYTILHAPKFEKLKALSLGRTLTLYMPMVVYDCCLRLTTSYDEQMFTELCGVHNSHADGVPFLARKDKILLVLGEDVYQAIRATTTWQQESELEAVTNCVKIWVFGGHALILDVLTPRDDGTALLQLCAVSLP